MSTSPDLMAMSRTYNLPSGKAAGTLRRLIDGFLDLAVIEATDVGKPLKQARADDVVHQHLRLLAHQGAELLQHDLPLDLERQCGNGFDPSGALAIGAHFSEKPFQ